MRKRVTQEITAMWRDLGESETGWHCALCRTESATKQLGMLLIGQKCYAHLVSITFPAKEN